jgi:hypothetical protein
MEDPVGDLSEILIFSALNGPVKILQDLLRAIKGIHPLEQYDLGPQILDLSLQVKGSLHQ